MTSAVEAFFLRFSLVCRSLDYEVGEVPFTPTSLYSFLGAEWRHGGALHIRALPRTVEKIFVPFENSTLREVLQAFGRLNYVGTLIDYPPSRLFYIYKFLGARYGWPLDGPVQVHFLPGKNGHGHVFETNGPFIARRINTLQTILSCFQMLRTLVGACSLPPLHQ